MLRTNPVTGWRSVFGVGHHAQRVNELSETESQRLLAWMSELITQNHDLQVYFFATRGRDDVFFPCPFVIFQKKEKRVFFRLI